LLENATHHLAPVGILPREALQERVERRWDALSLKGLLHEAVPER
jgi:hypothetical protein